MTIIQRLAHLAENMEQVLVTGPSDDPWSVFVVLLLPVDASQLEEGIPVVKGFPELIESLFRVANDHGVPLLARQFCFPSR